MDSSNRDDLILFISKTKLLNAVPASRIAELLSQLKQINLAKGDLLFSQGSLSDSVYILMKGKLCAYFLHPSKEPQIVGHIIQYETIGELGAISLEPRSLSVKAEVNSEVIEIPSNLFRNLCEEFPSILFSIVRPLVTRSLNTIKLLQPENKPEHVIIFSTERSINLLTFRQQIQDVIAANSNTKLVITSGTLNEQLGSDGSPDKSNKLYLTFIDEKTPPQVIEQLKHKTTNLYLVGDGTKNPAIDSFAAKLLDEDSSKYRIHLVLLYPEHHAALPVYTPAWKEKYNFFMHHHIHQNSTEDFQRMYRFFNGTPVGLVLGGGGVRGLAHFGVIKALLEKQIPIDVIGGSSVGAIAAFCYASSQNYAEAEQKFRAIFTSCYQTLSWRRLIWPLVSILSSSPATELTQEIFGNLLIENVWTNCFSVSSNLSTRKLHVHTQGLVWLAVRSSASTPGVFPPVVINGQLHFDGGLLNNLPADVMKNLLGPESKIIASKLSNPDVDKRVYDFPPALSIKETLLHKLRLGYKAYSFPSYLDMFINSLLLGSSQKEEDNGAIADLLINPNLFKFKSISVVKQENELIDIGYQETLKILASSKEKYFWK